MTDMATNAVVYSRKPMQSINRKILTILQVPFVIPQVLQATLESAAEAFVAKSYKSSAKYLKDALDSLSDIDVKTQPETIVLTKYMLCMCWLESTDAKDLLDALKILEELEKNYGYAYPMLYYAVGTAYCKLYRFAKADEILKKGFSILNGDTEVVEYKIPGTDVVIPESSRDRLVAALVTLNDQCSSWHRPNAVCCMPDCSSHSQNESADKNIFFGSPTFIGMVQVSCNNTSSPCTVSFHLACWKAKKENVCSLGKLSDKDLLHWECFTPNCEDQGVRCTIKKIEIFDENAKVKSSMTRPDEVVRHPKVAPQPPKGAIRKQQHQQTPKVKAPPERHPRPPVVPHDVHKTDEAEDDDDLVEEQALRAGVEELIGLRACNFGIGDEQIWRPNLSLYGNEFMLATVDALPDPDFTNGPPEDAELKAFFFSYFYTFISKSGPVKLDVLTEKWHEAQSILNKNCDSIFTHYIDIAEFLLQSVKFAMVGGYICVAEKLPETYDLAKSDACDILKFFMENDIDQRSDSFSVDDEAFYNDIVNPENNNSLPYSSIPEDSKTGTDDADMVFDEVANIVKKKDTPIGDGPDISKIGQYLQNATPNRPQTFKYKFPEFGTTAAVDDHTMGVASSPVKPFASHENVEKKKPNIPSQPVLPAEKMSTTGKKSAPKRAHIVEHVNGEISNCIEKTMPTGTKETRKNDDSQRKATDFLDHIHEMAWQWNAPSKPKAKAEKFKKESKSVNDMSTYRASTKDFGILMPNQTIPPPQTNENLSRNSENPFDARTRSEAKNEEKESLIGELVEEVQCLKSKLSASADRAAQLESEVAQLKKAHAAVRVKLLQKMLQGQYAYNHSYIIRKLDECRKNYEVISLMQGILMNSTGRTLPVNANVYQTTIADIEKILKSHQTKFSEMNDKLEKTTEPESITEVNMQPVLLPNVPTIDLSDAIQRSFDMYEAYVTNEIKRCQPFFKNPMGPNPYAFDVPQFRPMYGHNPGMMFPLNCMPNGPSTPNVSMPPPPYSPPSMHIEYVISSLPSPIPTTLHQIVPPQQIPPVRLQQTNTFPFGSTPSPAPVQQQSLPSPVNQSPSRYARPTYYIPDAPKVSQQSPKISSPELPKVDPPIQQDRKNSVESSSADNQPGDAQSSEKSDDQVLAQQKSTPSPVSSGFTDNSQNQLDIPVALNVASHDRYAKPKETKPRKNNYHSIDKLIQILRSRYVGVLELDLIKSVETVRKNHKNTLSGIPMSKIIREAARVINDRQQKQLCGYEKRPCQLFPMSNSSAWFSADGERNRENSMSSTSPVNSAKKESHGSKKGWEPVGIPNDTWQKQTPESKCIICFETMLHIAETNTLKCKHTFHKECIKKWYEQQQSCPTCRVHSTIDDEYPPLPLG